MLQELLNRNRQNKRLFIVSLLALLSVCNLSQSKPVTEITIVLSPTSTPDRLAEPVLPANPTQYEQGRHLYWLNCMPCHGDMGQGLTDEFRDLWVEDHQNCWTSGCHAGRPEDQGFPIPRTIPAIISSSGDLPRFASDVKLIEYLRTSHPPQHPGKLSEEECWAITDYVLIENKRISQDQEIGSRVGIVSNNMVLVFTIVGLVLVLVGVIFFWFRKRYNYYFPSDPKTQ